MPSRDKLAEFVAWCAAHITGDEKGEAQLFLDRLFPAFGQAGLKEAGATLEFHVARDAVLAAYGFSAGKDLLAQLLARSRAGRELRAGRQRSPTAQGRHPPHRRG